MQSQFVFWLKKRCNQLFFLLFVLVSQGVLFLATGLFLLTGLELVFHVYRFFVVFLSVQLYAHPNSVPCDKNVAVVLANHRSFTDFFLDGYILGGASYLSRWLVACGLPAVGCYGWLTGAAIFFNRGGTSRKVLAELIKNKLEQRPFPLILYPEGHRNLASKSLPLKHGGLKICFENKWPIQLMIVKGKENVLNERDQKIRWNQACYVMITPIIESTSYSTYEEFYAVVSKNWTDAWELCYNTAATKFKKLMPLKAPMSFAFNQRWLFAWSIITTIYCYKKGLLCV